MHVTQGHRIPTAPLLIRPKCDANTTAQTRTFSVTARNQNQLLCRANQNERSPLFDRGIADHFIPCLLFELILQLFSDVSTSLDRRFNSLLGKLLHCYWVRSARALQIFEQRAPIRGHDANIINDASKTAAGTGGPRQPINPFASTSSAMFAGIGVSQLGNSVRNIFMTSPHAYGCY